MRSFHVLVHFRIESLKHRGWFMGYFNKLSIYLDISINLFRVIRDDLDIFFFFSFLFLLFTNLFQLFSFLLKLFHCGIVVLFSFFMHLPHQTDQFWKFFLISFWKLFFLDFVLLLKKFQILRILAIINILSLFLLWFRLSLIE